MKRLSNASFLCFFGPRTVSVTQTGDADCVTAKCLKIDSILLRIVFFRVVPLVPLQNDPFTEVLFILLKDYTPF